MFAFLNYHYMWKSWLSALKVTNCRLLSGGGNVESGVSVHKFHEATEVFMATLTPEIIKAYIDTGEPMWVEFCFVLLQCMLL